MHLDLIDDIYAMEKSNSHFEHFHTGGWTGCHRRSDRLYGVLPDRLQNTAGQTACNSRLDRLSQPDRLAAIFGRQHMPPCFLVKLAYQEIIMKLKAHRNNVELKQIKHASL